MTLSSSSSPSSSSWTSCRGGCELRVDALRRDGSGATVLAATTYLRIIFQSITRVPLCARHPFYKSQHTHTLLPNLLPGQPPLFFLRSSSLALSGRLAGLPGQSVSACSPATCAPPCRARSDRRASDAVPPRWRLAPGRQRRPACVERAGGEAVGDRKEGEKKKEWKERDSVAGGEMLRLSERRYARVHPGQGET